MKVRKFKKPNRFKERGKFIFKEQWYSLCGIHFIHDDNCTLCNSGSWQNVFIGKISSFFYKTMPKVWIFLVNFSFGKKKNFSNRYHQLNEF